MGFTIEDVREFMKGNQVGTAMLQFVREFDGEHLPAGTFITFKGEVFKGAAENLSARLNMNITDEQYEDGFGFRVFALKEEDYLIGMTYGYDIILEEGSK